MLGLITFQYHQNNNHNTINEFNDNIFYYSVLCKFYSPFAYLDYLFGSSEGLMRYAGQVGWQFYRWENCCPERLNEVQKGQATYQTSYSSLAGIINVGISLSWQNRVMGPEAKPEHICMTHQRHYIILNVFFFFLKRTTYCQTAHVCGADFTLGKLIHSFW